MPDRGAIDETWTWEDETKMLRTVEAALRADNEALRQTVASAYPCQRCGRRDGLDAAVTDEHWAIISGRTDAGGLLCLWCMDDLAAETGLEHVPVRLYFAGRVLFSVPLDEFTDLEWSDARALLAPEEEARRD